MLYSVTSSWEADRVWRIIHCLAVFAVKFAYFWFFSIRLWLPLLRLVALDLSKSCFLSILWYKLEENFHQTSSVYWCDHWYLSFVYLLVFYLRPVLKKSSLKPKYLQLHQNTHHPRLSPEQYKDFVSFWNIHCWLRKLYLGMVFWRL